MRGFFFISLNFKYVPTHRYDIDLVPGESYSRTFTRYSKAANVLTAIALVGYTAKFVVKKEAVDRDNSYPEILLLDTGVYDEDSGQGGGITINEDDGEVVIFIDAFLTEVLAIGKYYYELWIYGPTFPSSGAESKRLVRGEFNVTDRALDV